MALKPPNVAYIPPLNFAQVEDNIYRSAYPKKENIPFLLHKGIKTIALLSIEALPLSVSREISSYRPNSSERTTKYPKDGEMRIVEVADVFSWMTDSNNGMEDFSEGDVLTALQLAIDVRWHPILFTCPTGELQTSVVVGCLRRYQRWTLSSIFGECELFSRICPSPRQSVLTFISEFRPNDQLMSTVQLRYRSRTVRSQVKSSGETLERQRRKRQKELSKHHKRESASDENESSDSPVSSEDDDDDVYGKSLSSPKVIPLEPASNDLGTGGPLDIVGEAAGVEGQTTNGALPTYTGIAPWAVKVRCWEKNFDNHLIFMRDRQLKFIEQQSGKFPVTAEAALQEYALLPPYERYAGVLHPPSVDSRSKFTKESVIDDDGD